MENGEAGTELQPPREIKGYKALKELPAEELVAGQVVVHGLPPYKLWATQDWDSPEKIIRAGTAIAKGADPRDRIVDAYFRDMPTGQRAVILGDGHHFALRASERGDKVSVRIVGNLPEGKDFRSFSRFRRETGNSFRDIDV